MNKQIKQNTPTTPEGHQTLYNYEDEISLFDIWRILVTQRKWFFLVTIIVFLSAVAYSLLAPRVYQTKAILLPPLSSDVAKLSVWPKYKITGNKLYAKFMRNIGSVGLRKQFFEQNDLFSALTKDNDSHLSHGSVFQHQFQKLITIKKMGKRRSKSNAVSITLEGRQPKLIAKWLNNFISLADSHTVTLIANTIATKVDLQKKTLQEKIKLLRKSADVKRLDDIAALEEAIPIAEKLNLAEQADGFGSLRTRTDNLRLSTTINTIKQPLYLRGSKALRAEAESLKNRKNNDSFIPKLRTLQDQLAFLTNIHIDPAAIHAVRVDQPAYPPDYPIKPKRILIIVLGLFLGLMMGVFAAFVMNIVENIRQKGNEAYEA